MTMDIEPNQPPSEDATKAASASFSLAAVLSGDDDNLAHPTAKEVPDEEWVEINRDGSVAEGYCVECEGALPRMFSTRPDLTWSPTIRSTCATSL